MFAFEDEAKYYVFEMPEDNERQAAKPVRKIILETKEEVEHFFKALSDLQNVFKYKITPLDILIF